MIEVKGPGDRLSPEQKLWIQYLNTTVGIPTYVCYVKENTQETIQFELSKVKRSLQFFDESLNELNKSTKTSSFKYTSIVYV